MIEIGDPSATLAKRAARDDDKVRCVEDNIRKQ